MEADRLGFRQLFVVEHHFTGRGQVSASMTVLANLAATAAEHVAAAHIATDGGAGGSNT